MALFIILLLAGAYILVKGKINFSRDRELTRPKSIFAGVVLISLAVLMYFLNLDIFLIGGFSVLTLIGTYFLSDKVASSNDYSVDNKQNLIKFIVLIIFAALIAFAFWYFTKK